MIKWLFKILSQSVSFMRRMQRTKECRSCCLFCEYWDECRFIEDIDGVQTQMEDGYEAGYNEAKKELLKDYETLNSQQGETITDYLA